MYWQSQRTTTFTEHPVATLMQKFAGRSMVGLHLKWVATILIASSGCCLIISIEFVLSLSFALYCVDNYEVMFLVELLFVSWCSVGLSTLLSDWAKILWLSISPTQWMYSQTDTLIYARIAKFAVLVAEPAYAFSISTPLRSRAVVPHKSATNRPRFQAVSLRCSLRDPVGAWLLVCDERWKQGVPVTKSDTRTKLIRQKNLTFVW